MRSSTGLRSWALVQILLSCFVLCQTVQASVLTGPPFVFSQDESFDTQITALMGTVQYRRASTADLLSAVQVIKPGNIPSFNNTFYQLAERARLAAENTTDSITAQDYYFAASNYHRAADFYLHTNWTDPHITSY